VNWLKHAFAVETPGRAEPTEMQRSVVERLCQEVVRRRMTMPALLMLEMGRPLNYVSAQMLHFFQPFLSFLTNAAEYEAFTEFLEKRGSVEYISKRLESLDAGVKASPHATD
jgi:hypothetical protein